MQFSHHALFVNTNGMFLYAKTQIALAQHPYRKLF